MEHQFWHERWANNQIGFHQTDINGYLREYWPLLEVPKHSWVFVPLSGKSHDMLWLLQQGYQVLGIEISEVAVAAFFEEQQLTPQVKHLPHMTRWTFDELHILCGDFFALQAVDMADIVGVYDRAALIAFPPPMRTRYAAHLSQLLTAGSKTLLITLEYPQALMQGPPFSVTAAEVDTLFAKDFTIQPLLKKDVLAENARFKQKGLTELWECVYLLERRI